MRRFLVMPILGMLLLVLAVVAPAWAEVKLPAVISDHMVIQRGQPVAIWGWAAPAEKVTVTVGDQAVQAQASENGRWQVSLPARDAAGPLEIVVQGESGTKIVIQDVLVGEVWFGSGQSNMEWRVAASKDAETEIAAADYPRIRLFKVQKKTAAEPQTDCVGRWVECSPATVRDFSAVLYFFGRELHKQLDVPMGLIQTAWGGTPAEAWTSRQALESEPSLKPLLERWDKQLPAQADSPHRPANLYNAMIAPLVPYGIRGAIWYQGESNVTRAFQYRTLFPLMIRNWREVWGQGDFPFGLVQLAPFAYAKSWKTDAAFCAELREAQTMVLSSLPNTGMAVTMDIGDPKDIHPRNKQEVGRRLALWALAKVYGRDLVYSGPMYKAMAVEGNRIRITFDHVGSGLATRDGNPPSHFLIAGADQQFHPATATIDGNTVVVQSDQVPQPVAVRYAWEDAAEPNLMNKEGLPASPFRTDQWKCLTEGRD